MIPLADAQSHVVGAVSPLAPVIVALADATGLVAAAAVRAAEAVPGFDNTAMDGFAVRAADTAGASPAAPVALRVVATAAAGLAVDVEVGAGDAVRIMTGAAIPPGADAVVMVERTRPGDGATVLIEEEARAGDHVRRAGDDVQPGVEVLRAGDLLTAARIGVLAEVGVATLTVAPAPRVGVVSTGDELVGPGPPLQRGQIRDSNRPMLLALLARSGFVPVDLGWVPDDPGAIRDVLRRGAATCDAVVTSGGVSVGDFDHVKVVLDEIGDMRWMQVAIRPAKPLAFGTVDGVPVFGLPGNPVSSHVSFELFARPALRKMGGHPPDRWHRAAQPGVAGTALRRKPDGKVHFLRVTVAREAGALVARPAGGQGSHQLAALAAADALAVVPDGDGIDAGAPVDLLVLD